MCALLALAALPLLVGFTWPGTMEWLTTRGMSHYRAQRFDEAERSFARALLVDPGNATLTYDRGTARYRIGAFDTAAEDFTNAAKGGGEALVGDASYNLGNALFRAGDYQRAIEVYRERERNIPAP